MQFSQMSIDVQIVKRKLKSNVYFFLKALCISLRETYGTMKKLNTYSKDCAYISEYNK